MLHHLIALILHYGVALVFVNVFAEQIGAPIPAVPTLIIAGALARNGELSSTWVLTSAVIASLLADWIWFVLGRRYGYRILRTLCRISLSPDSCVRETEAYFDRWGMKSLLFAKFIPGFSTVAPPIAGATRASTIQFLIYDAVGAFFWAGSAVAAGRLFHSAIGKLLKRLEDLGWWAVIFVASVIALIVFLKWWQRLQFYKKLRVARVTVDDLKSMLDRGESPIVLDVRTAGSRKRNMQRIPSAIVASGPEEVAAQLERVPPSSPIILYCT
ncbi:MAG TPA: VTT domain-containing protein [Thermoanaerobaculia bacterium]|nr:VTT domain-containing protein [Thermoanaerobaculia bacterium]